jgi:hypothetical protein
VICNKFMAFDMGNGVFGVGCQSGTAEWWHENGKRLADYNGLTEAQYAEWLAVLGLFEAIGTKVPAEVK